MGNTQHERFLQRLDASQRAVMLVAAMQNARGHAVEIPKTRRAPTAAEAEDHVDGGDLFVVVRHRLEVKHIGRDFTGADDWPFREVFVSNVASVDRAGGEVSAYVTVSNDYSHVAIVSRGTREHWYIVETMARNTGNVERFYACPLHLVSFRPTTEVISP